ncbi:MAG TPA: hypothetical protein VL426_06635 [Candidatus Binatia bacterium]|nr:hypothetical protein [Candidatus Binatia bacterium]
MQGSDLSLGDFIGSNAVDRPVADLGMRLAWPVLQKARLGRYDRSGETTFDAASLCDPVERATGVHPLSVRLHTQRDVFEARRGETRYGDLVDFNDSLAVALLNGNWKRLRALYDARYGRDGYHAFHDGLWTAIRADVARPLRFQFWDDPDVMPISSAGESLATTLFYLLAFATQGDREAVERLSGLAKLVGKAIPIGAVKKEPGTWLFVAPSE